MKITEKILKKPLIIMIITVLIIVVGLFGLKFLPLEKYPDIQIPKIIVTVPYIGAAPNELENEVIRKIEEKIRKISDVKKITSYAAYSRATIIVEFHTNVDQDDAKNDVKSAVDEAMPDLPSGIETPIITDIDLSDRPIMSVTIFGNITDYRKLRQIGDDMATPLESVDGVSGVTVFGGLEREIRVNLNPLKLKAYKLSINKIIDFIKNSNINLPGGNFTVRNSEYRIRILGRFNNVADLRESIIAYRQNPYNPASKLPVKLGEIAEVVDGSAEVETISRYNGKPCITFSIRKKKDANTLKVSELIKRKFKELEKSFLLQHKLKYAIVGDDSYDIRKSTNNLFSSIWQGIIAIFIVLWIGMGFRNGLIAALAVPFCLVFTLAGLLLLGVSLNNLVQFGLMIVIGMVVDGAIVILENIYRHRENGQTKRKSTIDGVDEVGSSVTASLLTTMAAFSPLLFMTGGIGKFFAYIPIAVLLALTASYIFDHFVIPIIANRFMSDPLHKLKFSFIKKKKVKASDYIKKEKTKVKKEKKHRYKKFIHWAINHRFKVVTLTLMIFIVGLMIFGSRPKELFPNANETKVYIKLELPPIASINQTDSIVKKIEQEFCKKYKNQKIIKHYVSTIGSPANTMRSGFSPSYDALGEITIELVEDEFRKNFSLDKMLKLARKFVKDIPNAKFTVESTRANPNQSDPVNVVIRGQDIRVLKLLSRRVQSTIRKNVAGAVDIRDNYGTGLPQIQVIINRKKANLHGISVRDISNTISVLYNGLEVSNYYSRNDEIKVRLKIKDNFSKQIRDLNKLYVYKSSTKKMIQLSELVKIRMASGISTIAREDMVRAITISGNTSGRTSTEVMTDVKRVLKNFSLPNGYTMFFRGENEDRDESFKSLGIAFVVALLLMYFIITLQLGSFTQPISIVATIMLSIIGVAFGLLISNSNVGLMSMFGLVALAGVVVNDAIVLVSYINLIRKKGYSRKEALIDACQTRVRPILMTTFTTIAGLMPLALGLGGSTTKFWSPMAWAIIGGLLFATIQTLIVVPIIYTLVEDTTNFIKRAVKSTIKLIKKTVLFLLKKIFRIELEYISNYKTEKDMLVNPKTEETQDKDKDLIFEEI